jgi:SAM-dependent methyltransferase
MTADREELRRTFDRAADLYQRARPDYPEALFDRLLDVTGVGAGDRVLEVGCATGKATGALARRGLGLTAVELGPSLAAAARRNLAGFPNVDVIEGNFDVWEPPQPHSFDLLFAATAWQWTDPTLRYERAAHSLRPGGYLAFWDAWHVFPVGGDRFFHEIQDVYEEIGEGLKPGERYLRPGELEVRRDEIEASGGFEVVSIDHFDWEVVYDADGYIDLLRTFSGHIAMEPWQRDRLFTEIRRRLALRPDGLLRRHWGAVLHVAQRVGRGA